MAKVDGVAPPELVRAVTKAAASSGTGFKVLLASSLAESRYDSSAKNPRSSATGAFQFTERTWLDLIRRHGAQVGLGDVATLVRDNRGTPVVANSADRHHILSLRQNPTIAAQMAARYSDENRAALTRSLGRPVTDNEVRMAYLLGASGAGKLLSAAKNDPGRPADAVLPNAVKSNPTLFKNPDGRVRSAAEAVAALDQRFTQELARVRVADASGGASQASLLVGLLEDGTDPSSVA
jgi:hypothetical protein